MRLPSWIARWFKKPEPQQARIPHADEEGDRLRKIELLKWNRGELAVRVAKLKKAKKKHSHIQETLDNMTTEQLRLARRA